MTRFAVILVLAVALAGCGAAEEEAPSAPGQGGTATRLVVEVRPRGDDGPAQRRVVTRTELTEADLAPVDPQTACTEIFGGPQTARVTGTLRGEAVDARFSRQNGCEIARWDRAASLLGRVEGPGTLP